MWQSLKPFFEWSDKVWIGQAISGTIWAFPVIETIHILALTMMFGAIVIIDLRMLGFGLKKQPVAVLAKNLEPYMTWGMLTMLATGYMLFTSEAMKCFVNDGSLLQGKGVGPGVFGRRKKADLARTALKDAEGRRSRKPRSLF